MQLRDQIHNYLIFSNYIFICFPLLSPKRRVVFPLRAQKSSDYPIGSIAAFPYILYLISPICEME